MAAELPPVSPSSRLASRSPTARPLDGLVAQLSAEMTRRWQAGERPLVEEFLARHPRLAEQADAVLDLVYEEVCLRQQYGETIPSAALLARFPRWREPLRLLLDCHDLLEDEVRQPVSPDAGETLGDYRLLAELGRGALGRVFLAAQQSLADRRVVLKVVPRSGQEHLSLARLQHTHIVPLYAVHDDAVRNVRVLCMPYFGSVTLARLREALARRPTPWRTGQDLLRALDETQIEGERGAEAARSPARAFLARVSGVEAVCWIGLCLAEGLQYAHERGLVHLDVKPSNVLLAADGQPMLLDFHLARPPLAAGEAPPDWLGGTPACMAPEQRDALAAVRARRPLRTAVGPPADVFSLGLLLYEMLGGTIPDQPGRLPPLHRCNPAVGVGLSDVIGKCLAADPRQRYASAGELAGDLRAVLADRPLRGVRNRSLGERWRRWRRPHAPWWLVIAVLLVGLAVAGGRLWRQRLDQAEHRLRDGRGHMHARQYEVAEEQFRHGLSLVDGWPGGQDLRRELNRNLWKVRRRQALRELHTLVERLRSLYPFDAVPAPALQALAESFRACWEKRGRIGDLAGDELGAGAAGSLRADLLDLAILGTELRIRLAGADRASAGAEGLEVLDRAESLLGPSPVLTYERRRLLVLLGRLPTELADAEPPAARTAWGHYALGRSLLRGGELDRAAEHFEEAVRLQPEGLWPNFYRGQCCYRQQRYREAALSFSVCIGSAPNVAACWFNRALACAALGDIDRALHDYRAAFQRDSSLAAAPLNCGILYYQSRRYDGAERELRRALAAGADPAVVHFNLALVFRANRDLPAALESIGQALRYNPHHAEAAALQKALQAAQKHEGLPRDP